jgi:hypothetical protein
MKRLRSAALAACLLCLALPAVSRAGTAAGINVPGGPSAAGNIAAAAATGAQYARVFMFWDGLQPAEGSLDPALLSAYKGIADQAQAAHVKLIYVVTTSPGWAGGGGSHPPANVPAFGDFMGEIAGELKGKVAAWEIWNEEDEAAFWGTAGGDPARYAEMLRAAYPKIKAADPAAVVVMGGLTGNNYDFLEKVYANGGGGSFDAVSAHTDTACSIVGPDSYLRDQNGRVNRYSFLGFRELRASMAAHGDGAKPIWLTEMGWSTSGKVCDTGMWAGQKAGGVSEADQARFLSQAYHCLNLWSDANVAASFWFSYRDETSEGTPDHTFGLTRFDGTQKASLGTFSDYAAHGDRLSGGCGDFDPPSLTVAAPTADMQYATALAFRITASDPSGVRRISFYADGATKAIRNFDDRSAPGTLTGSFDWQHARDLAMGAHSIRITATDRLGNVASRTVTVRKVPESQLKAVASRTSLKLSGKGHKRTVRVKVSGPVTLNRISGKATVSFAKKVNGTWRVAHKYTKPAKAAFKLKVSLAPATWRVRAVFSGSAGYRRSSSKWVRFTLR